MVLSTLLDIYAKYGSVEKIDKLFDKMHDANPHPYNFDRFILVILMLYMTVYTSCVTLII